MNTTATPSPHETPWPRWAVLASWALIALGTLPRLAGYVANRALWWDEAILARSVEQRPIARLFEPLELDQTAPAGFALLQKLAVLLIGHNEYAHRLVPLLASLVAMVLFYHLAKRLFGPIAGLVAMAMFAFAPPLIYFASEAKQYATDVFFCVLLVWLTLHMISRRRRFFDWFVLAFAGMIGVWVSSPSVFVLAGCGLVLLAYAIRGRSRVRIVSTCVVGTWWLFSFAVLYFVLLRSQLGNATIQSTWAGAQGFAPFPPVSVDDLKWYGHALFDFFIDPMGWQLTWLGPACILVGLIVLIRQRRLTVIALLALPVVFTLIASMLHAYPFATSQRFEIPLWGRVVTFIVPLAILVIALAVEGVWRLRNVQSRSLAGLLVVLLLAPLVYDAVRVTLSPRKVQETRDVMRYVADHMQPGDTVYVFWTAIPCFDYYADKIGFDDVEVVRGTVNTRDEDGLAYHIGSLHGKNRAWVIFSTIHDWTRQPYQQRMLDSLDRIGTREETFTAHHAAAYRYDARTLP